MHIKGQIQLDKQDKTFHISANGGKDLSKGKYMSYGGNGRICLYWEKYNKTFITKNLFNGSTEVLIAPFGPDKIKECRYVISYWLRESRIKNCPELINKVILGYLLEKIPDTNIPLLDSNLKDIPDHNKVLSNYYKYYGSYLEKKVIYDKAIEYYNKALEINLKINDSEHPDTATTLNNIAAVYDAQGKYEESLKYFFRALKIREKKLGPEHPDTATTLNNIAGVYADQGKHEESLKYNFRALKIREKKLALSILILLLHLIILLWYMMPKVNMKNLSNTILEH